MGWDRVVWYGMVWYGVSLKMWCKEWDGIGVWYGMVWYKGWERCVVWDGQWVGCMVLMELVWCDRVLYGGMVWYRGWDGVILWDGVGMGRAVWYWYDVAWYCMVVWYEMGDGMECILWGGMCGIEGIGMMRYGIVWWDGMEWGVSYGMGWA